MKPGTRDGEEGFYLYDKSEQYAVPTAFIDKKPYVTKRGISRPGRVTTLRDDRASAKRVRALYDWMERDEPKGQKPRIRPNTKLLDGEGDNRTEVYVDAAGRELPGTTRTYRDGRLATMEVVQLDGEQLKDVVRRTMKWMIDVEPGLSDAAVLYLTNDGAYYQFTDNNVPGGDVPMGNNAGDAISRAQKSDKPVIVIDADGAEVFWPDVKQETERRPAKPQAEPTTGPKPLPPEASEPAPASKPTTGPSKPQAEPDVEAEKAQTAPKAETPKRPEPRLPDGGVSLGDRREAIAAKFPGPWADRMDKAGFAQSAKQAMRGKDGVAKDAIVLVETGGSDGIAAFDEDSHEVAEAIPRGYVVDFGHVIPGLAPESHSIVSVGPNQLEQAIKTLNQRGRDVVFVGNDFTATHFPARRKTEAPETPLPEPKAEQSPQPAEQGQEETEGVEPGNRLNITVADYDALKVGGKYAAQSHLSERAKKAPIPKEEPEKTDTPEFQETLDIFKKKLARVREMYGKDFPNLDTDTLLSDRYGSHTLNALLNVLELRLERQEKVRGNPGNAAFEQALERNTKGLKEALANARRRLREIEAWKLTEQARNADGTFSVPQTNEHGITVWGGVGSKNLVQSNRAEAFVLLEDDREAKRVVKRALPGRPEASLAGKKAFDRDKADALLEPFLGNDVSRRALMETYAYKGYYFSTNGFALAFVKAEDGVQDEKVGRKYGMGGPRVETIPHTPVSSKPDDTNKLGYSNNALDVERLLSQLRAYRVEATRQGFDIEKAPAVALWDLGDGRIGLSSTSEGGQEPLYADFDVSGAAKPIVAVNGVYLEKALALFRRVGERPRLEVFDESDHGREGLRTLVLNGQKGARVSATLIGMRRQGQPFNFDGILKRFRELSGPGGETKPKMSLPKAPSQSSAPAPKADTRPFENSGLINQEALKDPRTLSVIEKIFANADKRREEERRKREEAIKRLKESGFKNVLLSDGLIELASIPGARPGDLGNGWVADVSRDVKALLVKEGFAPADSIVITLDGDMWGAWDESADTLANELPNTSVTSRGERHFVTIAPRSEGSPRHKITSRGHAVIQLRREEDGSRGWTVAVYPPDWRTPGEREKVTEAQGLPTPQGPQKPKTATPEPKPAPQEPKATEAEQKALDDLEDVLKSTGLLREGDEGDNRPVQVGMLREDEPAKLTPEQTTAVQNAMNKVIAASVETADVRSFDAIATRLYGLVGAKNPRLWAAMKPFLRGAWVTYGDRNEGLNLDEPSRAEARAIFERVEAAPTQETAPEQEQASAQETAPAQEQAAPTETQAKPEPAVQTQQPEPQEEPKQAPAPQPAPTDWAGAKNGDIRVGQDGKAYIRWEDYWLEPAAGKVRKWVGSRKRGRMETVEVEGVNVHDRLLDGRPGDRAMVFFEPDGKWTNPNNGRVHYGHMQALVDDPKNGYRWTSLDRWADDRSPYDDIARAKDARDAAKNGTLRSNAEPRQQKEDGNERTGVQPAPGQGGGAMGGQESSGDGGHGVGGDGAGVSERPVPMPGGADVSQGLAGEQPAEGLSDDGRGVGGRTEERGGTSRGDDGATVPVQPEGGAGGVGVGNPPEQSAGGHGGRGAGQDESAPQPAQKPNPVNQAAEPPATENYQIPSSEIYEKSLNTPNKRIRANIEALRLLKRLEADGRQATRSEQGILARYTGWGSLGEQFFNEENAEWAAEREELKGILTKEEFETARRTVQYAHYTPIEIARAMWDIVSSTGATGNNLSIFEAGLGVGRFIGTMPLWQQGSRYSGVEMDPVSAAIARQLYPKADILTAPYQEAPAPHNRYDLVIGNPPYSSLKVSDKNFKAGDGLSLHNFFIAKQIEALRPGGIGIFLVTHAFLDAENRSVREWIAKRAELLGAIRMPDSLFKSVDAKVVTDIVIFKKRSDIFDDPTEDSWVYTYEITTFDSDGERLPDFNLSGLFFLEENGQKPGSYFLKLRSKNIPLATVSFRNSTRYGRDSARAEMVIDGVANKDYILNWLEKTGDTMTGAFVPRALGSQDPDAIQDRLADQPIAKIGGGATHPSLMEGGHFVGGDGKLYLAVKNELGTLSGREVMDYDEKAEKAAYARNPRVTNKGGPAKFDRWRDVPDAYAKLTPKEREIMKALVRLREVRFDLAAEELKEDASEEVMSALRKQLNAAYDAFVEAARGYGGGKKKDPTLNEPKIRTLMYADPASSQLLGLEVVERLADGKGVKSITKNAIFTRRVNKPAWKPLEHYATAADAMLANLAASGKLDLEWIAGRIGKSAEETLKDLDGRVFINPRTGAPVVAEAYLSGDVKTKLAEAEEAVNAGNAQYEANVEALRKVQPEDIPADQLNVQFGSPILNEHFISEFFVQQMGATAYSDISAVYEPLRGQWKVISAKLPPDAAVKFPATSHSVKELMEAALNNKELKVYTEKIDKNGNETKELDKKATDEENATVSHIRDLWELWWKDASSTSAAYFAKYKEEHGGELPRSGDIGRDIVRAYNDRFNRIVDAQYNGGFLKFASLNPAITPYKHQRDAVWRTILTNNVLYNHVVGSGKTNTAVFSIMEMRRMGRVRKPAIVVPNHLVEQWKKEFLEAYPGANILAADSEDFQKHNRRRFFGRIQNGDYDAIVIPHSAITRIPMSEDITLAITQKELDKYRKSLEDAKKAGLSDMTVKQIEEMIERLENKIKAIINKTKADKTGLYFDTLGIDALFLDESHEFKNVPFVSSVQAKGMGNPAGSAKAFDLMMKVSYFRSMKKDAPVVFMSGTPVSNSLTELYLNMLYMAPDLLEHAGINSMDAFIKMFGKISHEIEPTLTGSRESVLRFRKLINVPELMHMVRTYMDVVDAEDLRGSMEAVGRAYNVPTIEGGRPKLIVAKRSEEQEWYFGKMLKRVQNQDGSFTKVYNEGSIYHRSKNLPSDPSEDNMLKIITDAQMAALDMRLRQPDAPDFAGSRVNLCVQQIIADYKRFDSVKGTQMIFCDRSIPGSGIPKAKERLKDLRLDLRVAQINLEAEENDPSAGAGIATTNSDESLAAKVARLEGEIKELEDYIESGGFSVYDDIKRKLVNAGIPEDEIAFIHSAKDKNAKLAMFKKMNEGKIRVLLGSTSRMGAGTNANKRMVSLHHLDAPWRPSDMEQREGRIIRQGNLLMDEIPGFQVRIYRYGTEKTGDGGKYNILEQKNRALHRIYKANAAIREMDDVSDDVSANFNQMVAALSGSTLEPYLSELDRKFDELNRKVTTHNRAKQTAETALEDYSSAIATLNDRIANIEKMKSLARPKPDDKTNYYAGIEIVPHGSAPMTFNAKTITERMSREGEKSFAQLLEEGGSGSFVRYRGLTWVYNKAEMETVHERIVVTRFSIKDDTGKTIGATTDLVYPRGQGGTIPDSSILTRMDNQINNAEKAIGKLKGDIASYNELRRKIQKQIDEMPDMSELNKQWLDKRREKNWLEKAIEAGCETGKEARNYFDKSFPGKVPDYEWTTPEFDKKMGRGEETEAPQTGTLRETAAIPSEDYDRWNRALDNYQAGRLDPDRSVIVLRKTPEIIREALRSAAGDRFAGQKPITIRVENLDKITFENVYTDKGKHNIPVDELRKLQLELDSPVAIFVSQTRPDTSVVVVTELVDNDGKAKAIIALQYAYHPNGDYASLVPMNANVLSSAYGKKKVGKDVELLYVNTKKASSWEAATRLQLPFPVLPSRVAGQSAVLTEKDFSMDDKGRVLKGGKLVNPKNVGMTRENGAWEKDLAKRLAKRGLTEDDLSPDAQAYLRARRARTEAQPMTRREKVAAFVEEAIHPHEGETRRAFAKRKAVAAADFVTRKMVDVRAPLIQAQREIAGETLQCRMSSGRARCGAASALPPSRMSDSCVRRRFRGDVAHQWCSGERVSPQTLPTLGPNPLGRVVFCRELWHKYGHGQRHNTFCLPSA